MAKKNVYFLLIGGARGLVDNDRVWKHRWWSKRWRPRQWQRPGHVQKNPAS